MEVFLNRQQPYQPRGGLTTLNSNFTTRDTQYLGACSCYCTEVFTVDRIPVSDQAFWKSLSGKTFTTCWAVHTTAG